MKSSLLLGNCQLVLYHLGKQESSFLQRFIQNFSEAICEHPDNQPDIQIFLKQIDNKKDRGKIRSSIERIMEEQPFAKKVFLYQQNSSSLHKLFSLCFEQAAIWHLERNSISLHSAAVGINDQNGFLFLGDSGNGKSTISQFCNDANFAVLGDDANFVIANPAGDYTLHFSPTVNQRPYPYSRQTPDLKAIFVLAQDTSDFLIKLPPHAIATRLFRSFQELYTNHGIPENYQRTAFHICCDIARKIPGYELHFTKSNQFLNTIKAEFHDAF